MYVRLSSFPSYIPLYSYAATLHYKKIQSFKIQRVGVCGVCVCSGDLELKKKIKKNTTAAHPRGPVV